MMMQMKASHAQQGVQAHGGAWSRLLSELSRRWFLIGIVLAITLAKTYPSIGAKGGRYQLVLQFACNHQNFGGVLAMYLS